MSTIEREGNSYQHGNNKQMQQNDSSGSLPHMQYIHYGEEDEMTMYGYAYDSVRSAVMWLATILTAGLLRLLLHWYPHWMLYATHQRCPLQNAHTVLFMENYQGKYKSYFVKKVKKISAENVSSSDINNPNDIVSNLSLGTIDSLHKTDKSVRIYLEDGSHRDVTSIRAVKCKKLCYVWDKETGMFLKLVGLDKGVPRRNFHELQGFSMQEQFLRRIVYGNNEIEVPVQSILTLLLLEVLNPFYIFQVFTIGVWFAEQYYYYTIAIVIMSVFGISSSIVQTRRNQINLRGTVHSTDLVTVCRGVNKDIRQDIPSSHIVPGDVIIIPPHGCVMHCDAVLLNGNCIVNESMLTGESVPVTKTPLPINNSLYNIKEDSNHTLFCGTKVIQTRFYGPESVKAVVLQTGYLTAKGQLVRSIMYPPPADFKFEKDSYKFIGLLALIALLGFIYTVVLKIGRGMTAGNIAVKALDIITIVIPPALPAAMTVGKLYAQSRLQEQNIYCMNSRVINVSGSINCVCFDKTGTLTEDGLDLWGVLECSGDTKTAMVIPEKDPGKLSRGPLQIGMATCHSLTLIDGQLAGDPLDLKMFESTGWSLEEPSIPDTSKYDLLVPTVVKPPSKGGNADSDLLFEVAVLHQYQFSSTLQRMSIITKTLSTSYLEVYCKGSPEMIMSLSRPETVPSNILTVLREYTEQGYRVIAMGNKTLPDMNYLKIQKLPRIEVESDLNFAGLIIMENRLKLETTDVIKTLKGANIKIVMITGDNIQTAVSVARECHIINPDDMIIDVAAQAPTKASKDAISYTVSPTSSTTMQKTASTSCDLENGPDPNSGFKFVMTGNTWSVLRDHFEDILPRLITRGVVFARMSSDQKQQLVQHLQAIGYYVAMCGDGANDCGALKAAHAGISLSEAESSVASPFTAKDPNISCVPRVIREGRAALITSFGIFKFMVAYSLTEFLSVAVLYYIDSNLTDLQFLFIDICLVVNFAFFFGKTAAYVGPLVKEPPMTSLLSVMPLLSLSVHMVIMTAFQIISLIVVTQFSWFVPFEQKNENEYACYENYAVYCVSMFQYITLAIVFSKSSPYRKRVYTNLPFMTSLLLMTAVCTYITVYPAKWLSNLLQLVVPPEFDFQLVILAFACVNFICCYITESFILEYIFAKKILPKMCKSKKTLEYIRVEKELDANRDWPPVSSSTILPQLIHSEPERLPLMNVEVPPTKGNTNFGFESESKVFMPGTNMTTKL